MNDCNHKWIQSDAGADHIRRSELQESILALQKALEALVGASVCTGEDSENWTCLALIREGNAATVCPRCKAQQLLATISRPNRNDL